MGRGVRIDYTFMLFLMDQEERVCEACMNEYRQSYCFRGCAAVFDRSRTDGWCVSPVWVNKDGTTWLFQGTCCCFWRVRKRSTQPVRFCMRGWRHWVRRCQTSSSCRCIPLSLLRCRHASLNQPHLAPERWVCPQHNSVSSLECVGLPPCNAA